METPLLVSAILVPEVLFYPQLSLKLLQRQQARKEQKGKKVSWVVFITVWVVLSTEESLQFLDQTKVSLWVRLFLFQPSLVVKMLHKGNWPISNINQYYVGCSIAPSLRARDKLYYFHHNLHHLPAS